MRTRGSRSPSASVSSPATASCGAGTGSSRKARVPRPPSDCSAPTGSRSWPTNCRDCSRAVDAAAPSATRLSGKWRNAGRPPNRRATPRSPPSAMLAMRPGRSMPQLRRSSGSRRSAAGWRSGRRISSRCWKRRARRSSASERSLAALPDPAALEQDVEAARGQLRQVPQPRSPTSARKRPPGRARALPIASGLSAAGARAGGVAQAAAKMPRRGSRQGVERQQAAGRRAERAGKGAGRARFENPRARTVERREPGPDRRSRRRRARR